ncbi:MAG: DNA mismatch repair endonuclease MutH [Succinivibrio sp.]|nr:DNA mismatch repair endonuclease MutH [Succinivibrio sp.]
MHTSLLQFVQRPAPPEDFSTLKQRIEGILGRSVAELAKRYQLKVPTSSLKGKGFTGELIEICLGASAQSSPLPDFPHLGVELKTMPISSNFTPLESTFITYAPLMHTAGLKFEESSLYKKLKRVLWIFVLAPRSSPLSERKIVGYRFWTPDPQTLRQIQADFEEIYELINCGRIDEISAQLGEIIQLRPKAANGRALTEALGPEGDVIATRPRGFYMRASFTRQLLQSFIASQAKS